MAYDASRQRVVLFGGAVGFGFSGIVADTWEWDGVDWTQKFPATSPSPRLLSAMAYDAARQQIVLFGGSPGSPTGLADTWVWDGTNWTQRFPADSPQGRCCHSLAFDTARGNVVLFGSTPDGFTFFSDTWVWDGTNWTQKFPATSPPIPRFHYRVAYDAARQQIVLFGGQGPNNTPLYNDTWVWNGINWTQQFPATSPPGRTLHAMAYDEARTQIVVFGGYTGASDGSSANDTWRARMSLIHILHNVYHGCGIFALGGALIGVAIVVFVTMPANCSFDTFRLIGDAIAFDCTNRSLPYPSATLFMVPATDVVAGFVVGGVLGYGVQELQEACEVASYTSSSKEVTYLIPFFGAVKSLELYAARHVRMHVRMHRGTPR